MSRTYIERHHHEGFRLPRAVVGGRQAGPCQGSGLQPLASHLPRDVCLGVRAYCFGAVPPCRVIYYERCQEMGPGALGHRAAGPVRDFLRGWPAVRLLVCGLLGAPRAYFDHVLS